MKKDIVEFVAQCPNCQHVKIKHQKPCGLLRVIEILTWKWEVINMDFIIGLPRTQHKFDAKWVIVDRLAKASHLLSIRTTYSVEDYARIYIRDIVQLHGVPISNISDRGAQFTVNFWRSFQKRLGTQIEVLSLQLISGGPSKKDWGLRIQMAPYEALYIQKCRSPIEWFKVGETKLVGPEFLRCISDPYKVIPVDDVQVTEQLSYEEAPIALLDRQVQRLRTKDVASVKVIWINNNVKDMTWEAGEEMKTRWRYIRVNYVYMGNGKGYGVIYAPPPNQLIYVDDFSHSG
ncbi:uncharacterized protein [Nicotiana tomentosiformis]|uniref:uncharacterized protein n=1 Tax=Nicotiana tomentosiformis TaxID=4098 RepID=UPI00388CC604